MCVTYTLVREPNVTEEVDASVTLLPDGDSCLMIQSFLTHSSVKEHSLEIIHVAFTFIFESFLLLSKRFRNFGFFIFFYLFFFPKFWPETCGMFHRN